MYIDMKEIALTPSEENPTRERESLRRALTKKDYDRAFTKVCINIKRFCDNIDMLQDYSLRIGSSSDNKAKSTQIDSIILSTADMFSETFTLINDIKEYDYTTKNEKIENITEATDLEDKCNKYQQQYEQLVNKIKIQNMNIIRQSFVFNSMSSFDLNDMGRKNSSNKQLFNNGIEFLDGVENKQKQNETIDQATFIIAATASRKNSIQNLLMTMKKENTRKGNDSMELKMETNISNAFTMKPKSCIRRYWLLILICIVLIGVVIWFIYE